MSKAHCRLVFGRDVSVSRRDIWYSLFRGVLGSSQATREANLSDMSSPLSPVIAALSDFSGNEFMGLISRPIVYISYRWVDTVHEGRLARAPDPRGLEIADRLRESGVPIDDETWLEIVEAAKSHNVAIAERQAYSRRGA